MYSKPFPQVVGSTKNNEERPPLVQTCKEEWTFFKHIWVTVSAKMILRYFFASLRKLCTVVPQTEQVPFMACLPFFIVTS
jgi:hypothetical protein